MGSRWCLTLAAVLAVSALACNVGLAQPGGRGQGGGFGGFGGQGGGGFGGAGGFGQMFDSALGLLMRDDIRRELAINEDQIKEFEDIQNEMREWGRDMFQGFQGQGRGGERPDFRRIQEDMQAKMKEIEEDIRSILLPHQTKRLDQLVIQNRQQRGALSALESLKEKLDISDEQMEQLKERAETAQKDFEEKMSKARQEMQESILSVLTSSQREQYKELVGDRFEFDRGGAFPGMQGQRNRNREGGEAPNRNRRRDDF
ncbi:MAG TPA: hypothetical protein PKD64_00325 [Pirellulaceae bacterium]|nr:hypothetical protein [Pirellulaceae bacterium]HMO90615.1 hypothetical protein [Pirellulaceae bacterium]HMP67806.1 hypothetical protein [Pirellulaceae bacterium]